VEDLEDALTRVAEMSDLILILADPQTLRFNVREMEAYKMLADRFKAKVEVSFRFRVWSLGDKLMAKVEVSFRFRVWNLGLMAKVVVRTVHREL